MMGMMDGMVGHFSRRPAMPCARPTVLFQSVSFVRSSALHPPSGCPRFAGSGWPVGAHREPS